MVNNWLKTLLHYRVKYMNKNIKKDYEDINFELLKNTTDRLEFREGYIDDITWNDLEMNKVFAKINDTSTLCGEELLYYWMRTPTQNSFDYLTREKKLDKLKFCQYSLITDLETVGQFDYDYRNIVINNKPSVRGDKKPTIIYSSFLLMILMYFISVKSVFLFGACFSLFAIVIFHYVYIMKNKRKIDSYAYIVRVASFYSKYSSLISDVYSKEYDTSELESVVEKITKFKNTFNQLEGLNPLKDIAVVLTLTTYFKSLTMEKIVFHNQNDILNIANIIGEIDLTQAVNRYKENNDVSEPVLFDNIKTLKLDDSYNVLIEDCVCNNIDLNKSIVITGSNMGGKSSYLRQIGMSIILSQSICLSFSKGHRGGFFTILSSISLNDDIESGKSYFMKEAEAIHRMLEYDAMRLNTVILIDEIFKGTNPIERLAASIEILNRLSATHKVIVTTHDIAILSDLIDFECYHFEHNISKDKLEFDYEIKLGVTEVRNAIKLMEHIKYPKDLINSIDERILNQNSIV